MTAPGSAPWTLYAGAQREDDRRMAATVIPRALELEIEDSLRPVCDLPDCSSRRYAPATWRIRVRHGLDTCETEELLICSRCREALHRVRHVQMTCAEHGDLGYSVASWWTPLGVLR